MSIWSTVTNSIPPPPDRTVGEIVAERPSRARIFEQLGIDYCCGGKKPLAIACGEKGLNPAVVLRAVTASDAAETARGETRATDWTRAPLGDLCDYIID